MSYLTNFNWLTKKILVYFTIHPYFFEFLLYVFKIKNLPAKRNCNNKEGFLFIFVLFPKKFIDGFCIYILPRNTASSIFTKHHFCVVVLISFSD
jgi:hypothetical protein